MKCFQAGSNINPLYTGGLFHYSSLPKTTNTLNIRTPKIIAKYNFKMFPKISNSG